MNSATQSTPSDFQTELNGLPASNCGLRLTSSFKVLQSLSPAENEKFCVLNGFPRSADILDLPMAKPATDETEPDPKKTVKKEPPLTPLENFEHLAKNIVLNSGEQNVLSMCHGIVRQVANYPLNPHSISESIQRMVKSAKEPVDFCKVATVLNLRLRNSELSYASVALQIENNKQFFAVYSRGEKVLRVGISNTV